MGQLPINNSTFLVEITHKTSTAFDTNLYSIGDIADAMLIDSAAISTATSKAVSTVQAAAPDSAGLSTADSKGVSAGSRASVADSKAVSDSANISVADSKAISGSVNTSIADSKATSTAIYTAAPSAVVSTADSKAVSVATYAALPGEGRTVTALSTYLTNNRVYNVRDYGALADGSDDSTAIQNAINRAYANAGGTVLLPPGSYSIATGLVMKAGVDLVGQVRGILRHPNETNPGSFKCGVQIKASAVMTNMISFTGSGAAGTIEEAGILLQDLLLEGNALAVNGFKATRCASVKLIRVQVHAVVTGPFILGDSAVATQAYGFYLRECYANGTGHTSNQILFDISADQVHLDRCLSDDAYYSVKIQNGSNEVFVDNCHFEGAWGYGIWIGGDGYDNRVVDSEIIVGSVLGGSTGSIGLYVENQQGVVIFRGNTLNGQGLASTKAIVLEAGADETFIDDNYVSGFATGVEIGSAITTWVVANRITTNSSGTALKLNAGVANAVIAHNRLDAPSGTAINNGTTSKTVRWAGNLVIAGTAATTSTNPYFTQQFYGDVAVQAGRITMPAYSSGLVSVTTLAVTIFNTAFASATQAAVVIVFGDDGIGNRFCDVVAYHQGSRGVIAAVSMAGAPAARTYGDGGSGSLQLTMGSGTYTVTASALEHFRV